MSNYIIIDVLAFAVVLSSYSSTKLKELCRKYAKRKNCNRAKENNK